MSFKKLKMAGFAHWILPVAAIVVVGGIGAYVLVASKATAQYSYACTALSVPSKIYGGRGTITATVKNNGLSTWNNTNSDAQFSFYDLNWNRKGQSLYSYQSYSVKPGSSTKISASNPALVANDWYYVRFQLKYPNGTLMSGSYCTAKFFYTY